MIHTNKQKKYLQSLAHSFKPVVTIGNSGLTDAVINETNSVLETHELIKAKVNADTKDDRKKIAEKMAKQTESTVVQIIGHIVILYRPRDKNPEISLPSK
jgi:RNA-binding protein